MSHPVSESLVRFPVSVQGPLTIKGSANTLSRFHVVILFVSNNDYYDLFLCIDIFKTG